ncbi:E3 ubiquitin-protein ligase rnf8 isoform X1 [Amia ocellicauda]|uniref:E3 ubiquitin-protein ligase rnf8 isoform X1 n=1 Tax=Amia ocellicauda TaxID=2972642 RepID=UPI00346420B7
MAEDKEPPSASTEEDDAAKGETWCLSRVGHRECLQLHDKTEVTLGRGLNVTYQLLSPSCPLMISRTHCVFKQDEDGHWTVMDKKSLNGVWVNGLRIATEKAHLLSLGDKIQLGVPIDGKEVEFEYFLERNSLQSLKPFLVKRPTEEADTGSKLRRIKRKYSGDLEATDSCDSKAKLYRCSSTDKPRGRVCPAEELSRQRTQGGEPAGPSSAGPGLEKPQQGSQGSTELASFQRHFRKMQVMKSKVQEAEQREACMLAQPDPPREELEQLQGQLDSLREQLRSEQQQQLRRVEMLEKTFCEEERRLENEKKRLEEESLKKKLDEALHEHREVIEELRRSRKDFEEIIQAKDKELEETKEEKEKARAQKEEVLTQMTEVLENELQCIICSELFIKAVTLNCAHSFCLHCISEWRKRKDECPICRQDILSQTRSLVLDNCIDRMVENLSSEMKERRESLIRQRKAQPVAVVVINDDDSSDLSVESSMSSILSQDETSSSWGSDTSSFSENSSYDAFFII